MATIKSDFLTLMDWATRKDPDGRIPAIVEMMNKTNDILEDMPFVEGNLPTGHETTMRTGLPKVAWRQINKGVQPSKSTTVKHTDVCGRLEAFSEIDEALVELAADVSAFRLSEDRPFIESMNQEMAETVFYGDLRKTPDRFLGIAPRFALKSAESGENILNGGMSGDAGTRRSSVYLVGWGNDTVHGIFPKGTQAGLQHEDLGRKEAHDAEGGRYMAYKGHYTWRMGLCVRDWRYIVRIANIDLDTLAGDTPANLMKLMIEASEIIPKLGLCKPAFYCTREVRTALRNQILEKNNVNLTWDTVAGKRVLAFDEIPVRRCDAISTSEAQISFA